MRVILIITALFVAVGAFAQHPAESINEVGMVIELTHEIGMAIELTPNATYIIQKVKPGSPASKAGLKKNDLITSVKKDENTETVQIAQLPLDEVSKLLKGPKGTKVTIEYLRAPEQGLKTVTLVRDAVSAR